MVDERPEPFFGLASEPEPPRPPRRRVRGLQVRAVPSWPLLAQLAGGVAALVGVYQEWGSPVALMVGGVAAVLVGALREAGKV
jgi:hypothetical protein